MKKTALVIMAAGIGSRYGDGIKQLAPVGPHGEYLMDYSIRDALDAGFNKVVFIIRKDLEKDFREGIGRRVEKIVETVYAFQELEALPEGFSVTPGRSKPWGTGQAVLCAGSVLTEPFAVINADDYYGKQAYRLLHDWLVQDRTGTEPLKLSMAGFRLKNTLSDHGTVTRGICSVSNGSLTGVDETKDIMKTENGASCKDGNGKTVALDPDALVSMNMWGLTPAFLELLRTGFVDFLSSLAAGDVKAEYLLPIFIDSLLKDGKVAVDVLETSDTWFGMTYQEDREAVRLALKELTEKGQYPDGLYL